MFRLSCKFCIQVTISISIFTISTQFDAVDYLINRQATSCSKYSICPDGISERESSEPCCKRNCICDEPCPYDNCCLEWSTNDFYCIIKSCDGITSRGTTMWPTTSFFGQTMDYVIDESYYMSCHDAKLLVNQFTTESSRKTTYYMIAKCPRDWEDNIIKSKCEMTNTNDSLIDINVPVQSLDSGASFRNVFCYYCHEGIQSSNYKRWKVSLMCPQGTPLDVLREIGFDPETFFKHFISNEFGPCNLLYSPSEQNTQYTQDCTPNLDYTCINHTTNYMLETLCFDFHMTIDVIEKYYPDINDEVIDCMLCSKPNITIYKQLCDESFLRRPEYYIEVIGVSQKAHHPVNEIFDPVISHGGNCQDGFIYDSYREQCRELYCPTYNYKKGISCHPMYLEVEHLHFTGTFEVTTDLRLSFVLMEEVFEIYWKDFLPFCHRYFEIFNFEIRLYTSDEYFDHALVKINFHGNEQTFVYNYALLYSFASSVRYIKVSLENYNVTLVTELTSKSFNQDDDLTEHNFKTFEIGLSVQSEEARIRFDPSSFCYRIIVNESEIRLESDSYVRILRNGLVVPRSDITFTTNSRKLLCQYNIIEDTRFLWLIEPILGLPNRKVSNIEFTSTHPYSNLTSTNFTSMSMSGCETIFIVYSGQIVLIWLVFVFVYF